MSTLSEVLHNPSRFFASYWLHFHHLEHQTSFHLHSDGFGTSSTKLPLSPSLVVLGPLPTLYFWVSLSLSHEPWALMGPHSSTKTSDEYQEFLSPFPQCGLFATFLDLAEHIGHCSSVQTT